MAFFKFVWERSKALTLSPVETWETVKLEDSSVPELLREYLFPGAFIPTAASFIGRWIIGISIPFWGVYHFSFGAALLIALFEYLFFVLWVWLSGRLITALAVRFDSLDDETTAMKLALFSILPFWTAGALNVIPAFHLLVLIFGIYCLYIFYHGLPVLMETPADKVLPFALLTVAGALIIYAVSTAILSGIAGVFGPNFHH